MVIMVKPYVNCQNFQGVSVHNFFSCEGQLVFFYVDQVLYIYIYIGSWTFLKVRLTACNIIGCDSQKKHIMNHYISPVSTDSENSQNLTIVCVKLMVLKVIKPDEFSIKPKKSFGSKISMHKKLSKMLYGVAFSTAEL